MKKRELRELLDAGREREEIYSERIDSLHQRVGDILEAADLATKLAHERISSLESELHAAQESARKTRELGIAGLLVMADALGVRVAQGDPTLGDAGEANTGLQAHFERSAASVDRAGGNRRCEECGIIGGHRTSCSQQFARAVQEDRDEDTEYKGARSELDEHAMATQPRAPFPPESSVHAPGRFPDEDEREQRRGGGLAVTEEGE